jgi:protein-L-isoaspartate O-methyltransferase
MNLIIGIFSFIATVVASLFFYHFAAPFAKSSDERIKNILALAGDLNNKKVADLGSGDGRVIAALAKAGAEAHGYEINPLLVRRSRKRIETENLGDCAVIHEGSFWKVDLADYDVIVVYGITYAMRRIQKKILRELKKGTKIISVYFIFPNLEQVEMKGDVRLYKLV